MRATDVQMLKCVDCGSKIVIEELSSEGDIVENALLKCEGCSRYYPVIRKVGIFFQKKSLSEYLKPHEIEQLIVA